MKYSKSMAGKWKLMEFLFHLTHCYSNLFNEGNQDELNYQLTLIIVYCIIDLTLNCDYIVIFTQCLPVLQGISYFEEFFFSKFMWKKKLFKITDISIFSGFSNKIFKKCTVFDIHKSIDNEIIVIFGKKMLKFSWIFEDASTS